MKKKIALYDPYLDTLGGGERYVLSILKALEVNYEPTIFWDDNIQKTIESKFAIAFDSNLNFLPNIFKHKGNLVEKIIYLRKFDIFLYVTDGSYFSSIAKKTFIYAMVPQKNLYRMTIFNRLRIGNSQFITHSRFNQENLHDWGISSKVLYPYINQVLFDTPHVKKDKTILSVGRFFKHLHAKQQDKMIRLFKKLRQEDNLYKEFRLILAGGLMEEDKDYIEELHNLIDNDHSIQLVINPSFKELLELYKNASYFWHFTGLGFNDKKNPELVEHLGITPLEAMAAGGIVFCYNAGGPKELISNQKTGFLFNNEEELISQMREVINNKKMGDDISLKARSYVKKTFKYDVFKENVNNIFIS